MSAPREGEGGFTLAEMLVVLAVFALVTGAGALALAGRGSERAVARAGEAIGAELRAARLEAMRSGRPVRLAFSPGGALSRDGGSPRFEAPAGLSVDLVTAREAAGEGTAGILFLPDGRSTGGRIELGMDASRRALVVDWLTGLVRAERP